MDDAFLIKQVNSGNRDAFRFLVIRYQRPIFKFLSSFSLSVPQREELAQETFLRAYQNLKSYDAAKGASFSSWLFVIAKNLALNALALHSHQKEAPTEDSDLALAIHSSVNLHSNLNPMELLEKHEAAQAVNLAIQELPKEFRSAVVLSFFNDLSLEEIAGIEHCSVGTVKSRVFRGKQLLRSLLMKVVKE